jgi:hypothetical protein
MKNISAQRLELNVCIRLATDYERSLKQAKLALARIFWRQSAEEKQTASALRGRRIETNN